MLQGIIIVLLFVAFAIYLSVADRYHKKHPKKQTAIFTVLPDCQSDFTLWTAKYVRGRLSTGYALIKENSEETARAVLIHRYGIHRSDIASVRPYNEATDKYIRYNYKEI